MFTKATARTTEDIQDLTVCICMDQTNLCGKQMIYWPLTRAPVLHPEPSPKQLYSTQKSKPTNILYSETILGYGIASRAQQIQLYGIQNYSTSQKFEPHPIHWFFIFIKKTLHVLSL